MKLFVSGILKQNSDFFIPYFPTRYSLFNMYSENMFLRKKKMPLKSTFD